MRYEFYCVNMIVVLVFFDAVSQPLYKFILCVAENTQHEHLSKSSYEHWDYRVGGIQTSNLREVFFCFCLYSNSSCEPGLLSAASAFLFFLNWVPGYLCLIYRPPEMLAPALYRLSPACWNSSARQQGPDWLRCLLVCLWSLSRAMSPPLVSSIIIWLVSLWS